MTRAQVDVAIVGGGPAGCAAALTLADAGASVALVEASGYDAWRCGETVWPAIRRPLEALGVWPGFVAAAHLPSLGAETYWGSPEASHHDFVFRPHGTGWHLDRGRFDAMLARAAADRGVELWRAQAVEAHDAAGGWRIDTTIGRLHARVLMHAGGRRSRFSLRPAGPRQVCDHTVAVGRLIGPLSVPPWILIEGSAAGWAYSAPVPDGRQVVMVFTDPDILRASSWDDLIAALPQTRARIGGDGERQASVPFVYSANAWRRTCIAGETWLCVGDAAAAVDPLSGLGVGRALSDGIAAGRTGLRMLAGDRDAGPAFAARIARRFDADRHTRLAYYRAETRWPDAPFWQRRQQPAVGRGAATA